MPAIFTYGHFFIQFVAYEAGFSHLAGPPFIGAAEQSCSESVPNGAAGEFSKEAKRTMHTVIVFWLVTCTIHPDCRCGN